MCADTTRVILSSLSEVSPIKEHVPHAGTQTVIFCQHPFQPGWHQESQMSQSTLIYPSWVNTHPKVQARHIWPASAEKPLIREKTSQHPTLLTSAS